MGFKASSVSIRQVSPRCVASPLDGEPVLGRLSDFCDAAICLGGKPAERS